jgi:hypothetical protein
MWTLGWYIVATAVGAINPGDTVASWNNQPLRRQNNSTTTLAIQQLVAGIGYNIVAQNGEKAVLSQLQSLSAASTPAPVFSQAAKDDLIALMGCGSRIRSNNMNLSGVNPQVTRGLAQVRVSRLHLTGTNH